MTEDKIQRRLEELEDRVAQMELRSAPPESDLKVVEPEFAKTVLRCTPRALDRWLREMPPEIRGSIFYGASRPVLLRLRESVSARSWDALLASWKQGEVHESNSWYIREALQHFKILVEMGEILDDESDGPIEIGIVRPMEPWTEAELAAARLKSRRTVEQTAKQAREWLERELPN